MNKKTQESAAQMPRPLHNDSGAVAVIVALMMVVLVGVAALVVDMGSLYVERRKMQTAADAAALAGVQELPGDPTEARRIAAAYVSVNASEATGVSISFPPGGNVANDTILVTVDTPEAPLFFARIWGQSSAPVAASAAARVTSPTAYGKGVMPLGILASGTIDPTQYWGIPRGTLIQIKYAGGSGTNGDYGMVTLQEGANWGESDVGDAIRLGGSGYPVYLNHIYSTTPGNKAPVDECLYGDPKKYSSWIGSDLHHYSDVCSAPDPVTGIVTISLAPGDVDRCHRLILLPVIVSVSGNPYEWPGGRKDVRIVGFAEFFVPPDSDLPGGSKPKDEIWGYLIRTVDVEELQGGAVGTTGQVHYSLVQ
ncbi:MAG TPA: pilus assembly protein TadG-related protein [Coriobacteriia bacterium]